MGCSNKESRGGTSRLPNSFSIEEGRTAYVWVDIVGRGAIRAGQVQRFHLLFGNRGNVDAAGVTVWIDILANNADIQAHLPGRIDASRPLNLGDGLATVFERPNVSTISITLMNIPPAFTAALPFDLLIPAVGQFEISLEVTAQ